MRHRYELPIFLASALLFAAYAGCDGAETTNPHTTTTSQGGAGGAGGAGSTTTTTKPSGTTTQSFPTTTPANAVGIGGAGGESPACWNGPNGICEPTKFEDCECEDCHGSALCVPGTCTTDGYCSHVWDACICPDCDANYDCADPAKKNCTDDGVCDSLVEGCVCPDCQGEAECADNIAACAGGAPDGACDLTSEPCACVDCFGLPGCVKCINDGLCGVSEPCFCPECAFTNYCKNPANCVADGLCDALDEGCHCADCADIPECNGGSSVPGSSSSGTGTGGGTGGGM